LAEPWWASGSLVNLFINIDEVAYILRDRFDNYTEIQDKPVAKGNYSSARGEMRLFGLDFFQAE
jgi:hypothetical protein